MRTPTRPAAVLLLLMLCPAAGAGPAPWWKWRSTLDGQTVCSQTPLGPGWVKQTDRGPYKDSRCEKLVLAK